MHTHGPTTTTKQSMLLLLYSESEWVRWGARCYKKNVCAPNKIPAHWLYLQLLISFSLFILFHCIPFCIHPCRVFISLPSVFALEEIGLLFLLSNTITTTIFVFPCDVWPVSIRSLPFVRFNIFCIRFSVAIWTGSEVNRYSAHRICSMWHAHFV